MIGEVFGNLKGGKAEMTFGELGAPDEEDDATFQIDTPLLRAAMSSAGDRPKPPRPSLPRGLTGGSYIKDSSVRESFGGMTTLSPDDAKAEKQYHKMLKFIDKTSHVHEAKRQTDKTNGVHKGGDGDAFEPENEKAMRAAVCAKLQDMPSVPNPPQRSVRYVILLLKALEEILT